MNVTSVERLIWTDPITEKIDVPAGQMILRIGYGSGLARRSGDAPTVFWAVGDRGPNLKVEAAVERYGLHQLAPLRELPGAKIMPQPAIGPAIAQFRDQQDLPLPGRCRMRTFSRASRRVAPAHPRAAQRRSERVATADLIEDLGPEYGRPPTDLGRPRRHGNARCRFIAVGQRQ
jgi:hypothetical protein